MKWYKMFLKMQIKRKIALLERVEKAESVLEYYINSYNGVK